MGSSKGHHNLEFYEYCLQFDTILLFLPLLSAHETQPMDVGVFRQLKDAHLEALFERADHRESAAPKSSTSRANATISSPVSASSSAADRPEISELARLGTFLAAHPRGGIETTWVLRKHASNHQRHQEAVLGAADIARAAGPRRGGVICPLSSGTATALAPREKSSLDHSPSSSSSESDSSWALANSAARSSSKPAPHSSSCGLWPNGQVGEIWCGLGHDRPVSVSPGGG